ncbi:DUF4190 domain-containing protein [Streptomyces sp. LP05-1]|uniref:DUF4190 domain-containing protein n=1 Tax=Streptomyces pyxinae TaxID=2970734 RepID=A0ABT2CFL1_9ACTN|nr:DUF4190 domain-containing protein [Streptomyces sp. LP05-1]MCS0636204.1 DUF4190 domain-containing protein [Streptomyces sp. LP05-1]
MSFEDYSGGPREGAAEPGRYQPYPAGGPQEPAPAPVRGNGMAIAALVLGVIGLLLFWSVFGGVILGLLALILGIVGARRARGGRARHRGMAVAGIVLGALALIGSVVVAAIGLSVLNSDEFKSYSDCVEHAKTQADRDDCSRQFQRDVDQKTR